MKNICDGIRLGVSAAERKRPFVLRSFQLNKSYSMSHNEYLELARTLFTYFLESLEEIQVQDSNLSDKQLIFLTAGIFLGVSQDPTLTFPFERKPAGDAKDKPAHSLPLSVHQQQQQLQYKDDKADQLLRELIEEV